MAIRRLHQPAGKFRVETRLVDEIEYQSTGSGVNFVCPGSIFKRLVVEGSNGEIVTNLVYINCFIKEWPIPRSIRKLLWQGADLYRKTIRDCPKQISRWNPRCQGFDRNHFGQSMFAV